MSKEATASLRLPTDLKREVQQVANREVRPLSSTLELLLRRGLAAYRKDGLLIPRVLDTELAGDDEAEAYGRELADKIMKVIKDRLEERDRGAALGGKKSKRA